jgi:hypothetical protein
VAQALIEDRFDEDYAGELLQKLESASIRLRPVATDDHSALALSVNDLALM